MLPSSSLALPLCRTADLAVLHVGDETLLYDQRMHQAYCLNAVTAMVWQSCDGTRTPANISALFDHGDTQIGESIVRLALSKLKNLQLIEGYSDADLPVVSRRAMLVRGGSGLALMLPVVALIAAPRAAQAYTGCFDCANASVMTQRRRALATEQQPRTKTPDSALSLPNE